MQIEVKTDPNEKSMLELFALCEDGSVWHRGIGVGNNRGLLDGSWVQIDPDGLNVE